MKTYPCSIVLIPGYMLDETLWDEFRKHLPQEWSVFDASLTGGKTIREIAHAIADHLPPKFVLIGFSLGGYIARQLAADFPDRVESLVIIASSLREDTEQQMESKQQAIQALSASTFKGLSRISIAKSLHPRNASDTRLISHIKQMGCRLGYQAFVEQSTLRRTDVPAATIHCPALIIASANDGLRSLDEANELVAAIPDASLQIFDGSGHMVPLEQPEELAQTIIHWLMESESNQEKFV
ncbi:alpha/beta fold hydrolase [Pantoea cypripedii]|uniref:alpha/beta fold hydrolase n=1 Tax=Pantoea cypripedii TaxID=55209 RepID=UPI001FC95724|nr:alpha/beta hydrolase [Pantoea cypripedii]MBP2198848.1 pimeloyl-ACP methyl ester carboxylesterase [Pantoea cypripedii]